MARAVLARSFGGPEVLEVVEVDDPVAGPGQVVVEVRAAGVNPADAKLVAGVFGSDPSMLPIHPGSEVAGVVTSVGPDAVDGALPGGSGPVRVGDEVIAYRVSGGYASAVAVRAASVFPKPSTLDWPAASGLMLAGATAWHLVEATRVEAGDRVIVLGASGGVGAMTVQLARLRGAHVIGVASAASAEYVASLGAAPVARGAELEARLREALGAGPAGPAGAVVVLDTVGGEGLDAAAALAADRTRVATIADFARGAELGALLLGGGPGADPGTAIRNAARAELVALAAEGALTVRVAATYPLSSAADAWRLPHAPGKVALLP
jgi:NADPH:quinone reductase